MQMYIYNNYDIVLAIPYQKPRLHRFQQTSRSEQVRRVPKNGKITRENEIGPRWILHSSPHASPWFLCRRSSWGFRNCSDLAARPSNGHGTSRVTPWGQGSPGSAAVGCWIIESLTVDSPENFPNKKQQR